LAKYARSLELIDLGGSISNIADKSFTAFVVNPNVLQELTLDSLTKVSDLVVSCILFNNAGKQITRLNLRRTRVSVGLWFNAGGLPEVTG